MKYKIIKFEEIKYLPHLIHQEKKNFYTLHQGNISNSYYLENLNNLVDMASKFKDQLHDQSIVDIATEVKYLVGRYKILDPDKK